MYRMGWPPECATTGHPLLLCALLLGTASVSLQAQAVAWNSLPEAPGYPSLPQNQGAAQSASITGTVLDSDGAEIAGATVVLEDEQSHVTRTCKSGVDGSFSFMALPEARYKLVVQMNGFATRTSEVVTQGGEAEQIPAFALEVASVNSSVDAVFSTYDLAEEQVKVEEKQRVMGIVPNFYVVYDWHAAPLTPGQKFRLALRVEVDPFTFLGSGIVAGIEQATNSFPGYGQGAAGFGKRYGASYADGFTGTLIGGAILPSILHQDPRYFYKGTGTITSRALYAIATVVICKGDNGKWQPNYSSVLGDLASAGISNAYYPASNRDSAGVTVDNALIGIASGAIGSLLQEFFLRHITPGTPHAPKSP